MAIDEVLHLSKLKNLDDKITSFHMYNYDSLQRKIYPKKILWETKNIFSSSTKNEIVQIFRNFFGEKIAFYFLWMIELNKWLIFPSLVGIALFIIKRIKLNDKSWSDNINNSINVSIMDLVHFVFTFILFCWGNFFNSKHYFS